MCRVLEVSAAGYYKWRKRSPSARATENERLLKQIEAAHAASRGTYGSPKVYRHLRRGGERVNHKRARAADASARHRVEAGQEVQGHDD